MKNHQLNFKKGRVDGEGEYLQNGNRNKLNYTPLMAVGLRILIQKSTTTGHSGVVATASKRPPSPPPPVNFSCFLRSCHLCRKELRPDKDVYMYRGDLGFCSIECREREMVVDDMKKLEDSSKKMVASSRHCGATDGSGQPSEISLLREELWRRHNQVPTQKTRPIFS